jgi:hypothetical protein
MLGKPALLGGAVLLAYVWFASQTLGDASAVFSGDVGIKLLQVANLVDGHPWLAVRGGDFDPAGRLFPLRPPFVFSEDGKVFSVYINPVIAIAAVLERLWGISGVLLIPLLSVVALVLLTVRLAARLVGPGPLSWTCGTLVLLATPVWFYGLVFYEHATASMLCLGATVLFVERGAGILNGFLCGALAGLAATCRPEAVLYLLAMACAIGWTRRAPAQLASLLLGGASCGLVWWAIAPAGGTWIHIWENLAAAVQSNPGSLLHERVVTAAHLVAGTMRLSLAPLPFGGDLLLASASVILVLLAVAGFPARRMQWASGGVMLLAAAMAIVVYLVDGRMLSTGLVSSCPMLIACGTGIRELSAAARRDEGLRFVGRSTLLFLVSVLLFAPNDGGNQWGPRYLLPAFPLLTVAVVRVLWRSPSSWKTNAPIAAIAIVTSLVIQSIGVVNHWQTIDEKDRAWKRIIAWPGERILTTAWFVPMEVAIPAMRASKSLSLIVGNEDYAYARRRLDETRTRSFALIEAGRTGGKDEAGEMADHQRVETFVFCVYPFLVRASLYER